MADSQVDEFCNITGAPRERAEFFLKAAGGNLQTAMDAFYEVEREEDNEEVSSFLYNIPRCYCVWVLISGSEMTLA